MIAEILKLAGVVVGVIGVLEALLMDKSWDRWIKKHLLTYSFYGLSEIRTFVAFAQGIAKRYLAFATFLGLPGLSGFSSIVLLTCTLNYLLFPIVRPYHNRLLTFVVPGVYHTPTEPEREFILVEEINKYALAKCTTATELLTDNSLDEIISQLPQPAPMSNPTKYFEWRNQPHPLQRYGPNKFESGFWYARQVGSVLGLICAFVGWGITTKLATRMLDTNGALVIGLLWLADIFASLLLTAIAVFSRTHSSMPVRRLAPSTIGLQLSRYFGWLALFGSRP